jgi:hypothetical protein
MDADEVFFFRIGVILRGSAGKSGFGCGFAALCPLWLNISPKKQLHVAALLPFVLGSSLFSVE